MAEARAPLPVHAGDVVGDKYRLLHRLGEGGMAVVMEAEHVQLRHHLALKFMRPEMCDHPEAVARFLREGRASAQIQSEHVAHVLDVGTVAGNVPYLAMELLNGCNLEQKLSTSGPLPVTEAADYVLQACEALAEAHALGIVHRDLKPANLFLARRRDGTLLVKVLDFGIAKAIDPVEPGSADLTATAAILGSPQYLPPEQLLSAKSVDHRADIWGLGTVLYELLTGHTPFDAPTLAAIATAIMRDAPVRPRTYRPDLPRELEAVVLRCLDKDRDKRFQNVAQLADALVPFAPAGTRASADRAGRFVTSVEPTTDELQMPWAEATTGGSQATTRRWIDAVVRWSTPRGQQMRAQRRKRSVVAISGGAAVALMMAIAVGLWAWPSPRRGGTSGPAAATASSEPSALSAAVGASTVPAPSTQTASAGERPSATESTPVAAASAVDTASASTAQPEPTTTSITAPGATAAAAAASGSPSAIGKASSTAGKRNCHPDYWLDTQGNKHFKAECFQ